MKKLLIALVVLSLTSFANASLFEISVNGDIVDETWIEVVPSGEITIDIHMLEPQFQGGDLRLLLSNTNAEIDATGYTYTDPIPTDVVPGAGYYAVVSPWEGAPSIVPEAPNPQSVLFTMGNLSNNTTGTDPTLGSYILLDNILVHCLGPGDVTLSLIAAGPVYYHDDTAGAFSTLYQAGTILDSIVIHQVPEPATLALLGLGGLFLRRRKK